MTERRKLSRDRNLWHLSHEGLDLEDPGKEPNYNKLLKLGVSPEQAPDEPTYIELEFEKGIPVKLNGESISPVDLMFKLNEIAKMESVYQIY